TEEIDFDKLLQGVREGERNISAIKIASLFRYRFDDRDRCWEELVTWNNHNKPPLPEAELRNIFNSAWKTKRPYFLKAVKKFMKEKAGIKKGSKLAFVENGIIHEAILLEGKPVYLTFDGEKFGIKPMADQTDDINFNDLLEFSPHEIKMADQMIRLIKTGVYIGEAVRDIASIFDRKTTLRLADKLFLIGSILLSYFQRFVDTVNLLFIFGETGSGKTFLGFLLALMFYRSKIIESPTEPNIYYYDGGFAKTLVLDEMRGLEKDIPMLRALRASTKRAEVLRLIDPRQTGEFKQVAFMVFGIKAIIREDLVDDQALLRRCILIHMINDPERKGVLDEEDKKAIENIRKKLLLSSMAIDSLPEINEDWLKGGIEYDLYGSILRVAKLCLPFYNALTEVIKSRIEREKKNVETTAEFWVAKAVGDLFKGEELRISFSEVWDKLVEIAELKSISEEKKNVFYSKHFEGVITKQSMGKILSRVFFPRREHTEKGSVIIFDPEDTSLGLIRYGLAKESVKTAKAVTKLYDIPLLSSVWSSDQPNTPLIKEKESKTDKKMIDQPDQPYNTSSPFEKGLSQEAQCGVCGKIFSSIRELLDHAREHED
ncbi:MAG: primase C-terminal domain-containing protein, partial [Nitrososphaerales archaeon]